MKFEVIGMSCSACVARVESAVSGIEGVEKCSVNLLTNSMIVEGNVSAESVILAVSKAGYGAIESDETVEIDSTKFEDKESPKLRKRLLLSLGFLIVLMYLSMGHVMYGWYLPEFLKSPITIASLELVLALIVMAINCKFFINGVKGIINRSPNMDTLVALGSGVSFFYSLYLYIEMLFATDKHHYLHEFYFESAGMILTLITIGKFLEAIAKGKTTSALRSLMDMSPKYATVLENGKEKIIKASELKPNDIFIVKNGERIPADAEVLSGEASVDESSLTGESNPSDKVVGDKVSASTICTSGFITCKAERTGANTAFAQIIKTVTEATSTKAPIAKIADKVSGIFVPSIMLIALFVAGIWLIIDGNFGVAIQRAISVLVISCPCALGLATPVAIMVGSGVGAKRGILFKTAEILENTGRTKIVALDKTGTITSGKMSVREIIPEKISSEELVSLAYSLEEKSEHPLAVAIVNYAIEKGILKEESTEFQTHAGAGVTATINGAKIVGGKADFVSKFAHISEPFVEKSNELASEGKTPLFFAKDGEFIGIIALFDTVKQSSYQAIKWLKENDIRTVMITGDNERTANAVAKEVGIDEVVAGVLPSGKEEKIRELIAQGKTLMVGDGVNDAPALAVADIGVAIGTGTDVAKDTAEVVIMKNDLVQLCDAIRVSKKVLTNIKQNLFWAFFYNMVAIPIASGALVGIGITLSPMIGALAMSLSSFCVVTNALRLNFFKPINRDNEQIEEGEDEMVTVIKVSGMMCPHCEARVKEALEKIEGVEKATPNHKKGIVKIKFDAPCEVSVLKNTIIDAGYKVE